jgi:Adenylate and Guanylate cyclase catalytic domain
MDFYALLDQVIDLLRQRQRVTYRALQRQFGFDDAYLEDLKAELIDAQRLAIDEEGKVLVWTGDTSTTAPAPSPSASTQERAPLTYTPSYLAEKILTSRSALEGERKQVTVLFADLKGSMELLADRDPEEARQLLDSVLERLMAAVHRYEGTVNQVMGDGIMALFGAPLAHEDHALRACYAALTMQTAMREYTATVRRAHGIEIRIRVGLNSGEVVVRHWQRPAHGLLGGGADHASSGPHGATGHARHDSPDGRHPAADRGPGIGARAAAPPGQGLNGAGGGV